MSAEQPTVTYKDIPGFPGYRVGDDGSVWTIKERGRWYRTSKKWHLMKQHPSNTKRPTVVLCHEGRQVTKLVHRLVIEAFVGPCPTGMECCHNDGNMNNNRLANLRWDTRKANREDMRRHGTLVQGEKIHNSKLTANQVISMRADHDEGISMTKLAKKYQMSMASVSLIINRKHWKHV